jgi:branched-chain amino acid transport system substrate-binding protein
VIIDALKRVRAADGTITRAAVRAAIQSAQVSTLQGGIAFDDNGDLKDRTVSIFQVRHDTTRPLEDLFAQYRYVGVAPQA